MRDYGLQIVNQAHCLECRERSIVAFFLCLQCHVQFFVHCGGSHDGLWSVLCRVAAVFFQRRVLTFTAGLPAGYPFLQSLWCCIFCVWY